MLSINLKDEVARAIASDWPDFAARHPNLARAIDRTLLIEQAAASIADAPEYRQAMENAAIAGTSAAMLSSVISRLVRDWLGRLWR